MGKAILCIWFSVIPFLSSAHASDFKPAATILRLHVQLDVDSRGRETIDETMALRVDRKDAISSFANRRIPFSPKLHKVEIIEAYTIDGEGRRYVVPHDSIKTQENAINTTTSQFSDYQYKVLVFPKVDVGSVLHLRHRIITKRQSLPGLLSYRMQINPRLIYEDARFSLRHPASMELQVGARSMSGGSLGIENGKKSYRYEYRQPVAQESEEAAVATSDYAPYFAVSSYRDRIEQGRDYQKNAAPKSVVTPEIQAVAERVTAGIEGRRAQIDALYHWVVQNIRYVSVIIDRSGLIPNSSKDILRRRYGDCKDHATLLGALLKAKGISSSPALINLGDAYTLEGPATISPLNHVIVYVPDENLFLDSTAQTARPGQLHPEIADKPVVLTALSKLGHTPGYTVENNRAETDVDLIINEQGGVKGRAIERFRGDVEIRLRDWAVDSQSNSIEKNVLAILSQHGERGKGRYVMGDPYDLTAPFDVVTEYELDAVTNVPGPGGWKIPNGLMTSLIKAQLETNADGVRKTPFVCHSRSIIERYSITFPGTMKILKLPPNESFDGSMLTYRATYKHEGEKVKVERVATKRYPGAVCGTEEWEEIKKYQEAIRRDLRGQFIY